MQTFPIYRKNFNVYRSFFYISNILIYNEQLNTTFEIKFDFEEKFCECLRYISHFAVT